MVVPESRAAKGRWSDHNSGTGLPGPHMMRDPSGMIPQVPGGP